MKKSIILDANAILRYILYDIPEQADITEKILQSEEVLVLTEVLAEVIYVMFKTYKIPREKTTETISKFLNEADCGNDILFSAVKTFGNENLDFVDCLLFAYSKQFNVFTFDEKLNKLIKSKS